MADRRTAWAPVTESVSVDGPVGPLETLVECVEERPALMALVCHPHPLHQGTMSNKVVFTLARSFTRLGAVAVRFNFRGVGESAGGYSGGVGETDDALALAGWMRQRWSHLDLYLAGFSFGAMIAAAAAARLPLRGLITVAPPLDKIEPRLARPQCPWLVIQGDADDVVPADGVVAGLRGYDPEPELKLLPGAGHFFHGRLADLDEAVTDFVGHIDGSE